VTAGAAGLIDRFALLPFGLIVVQEPDEGQHVPNILIAEALTERRHETLDAAILDDSKKISRRLFPHRGGVGKLGWRILQLRSVGAIPHAGVTMTRRAFLRVNGKPQPGIGRKRRRLLARRHSR